MSCVFFVGGEWKNYFMSLIFRYVHYPLYNLCFCFFLLPFKQQQGYIFFLVLWKNIEKKEKYKKIYLLQDFLKDFLFILFSWMDTRHVEGLLTGGRVVQKQFSDGGEKSFDFVWTKLRVFRFGFGLVME